MRLKEASILLVDDEPELLDVLSEWFRRVAGQVFGAADGVQALEILATHKIDLIITDVRMPVMDGVTLLKKIKANGSRPPSAIFVTGFADISIRDAYDLGAEALIEKPIPDDFIQVVERSLLEPNERWRNALDLSDSPVLSRRFESLDNALRDHRIAFGYGGFCMVTSEFVEFGPINIEINFEQDGEVLLGQGLVRWLEQGEIGVELTYVDQGLRARVVELAERSVAFIPWTTGRTRLELAA
jgi:CheY-like chemotaxis protein